MSTDNNEDFNVLDDLETPEDNTEASDITGIEKTLEDCEKYLEDSSSKGINLIHRVNPLRCLRQQAQNVTVLNNPNYSYFCL